MSDVSSVPADADVLMSDDDLTSYISQLSGRIVTELWQLPSLTQVNEVLESHVDDSYVKDHWCLCDKGF